MQKHSANNCDKQLIASESKADSSGSLPALLHNAVDRLHELRTLIETNGGSHENCARIDMLLQAASDMMLNAQAFDNEQSRTLLSQINAFCSRQQFIWLSRPGLNGTWPETQDECDE